MHRTIETPAATSLPLYRQVEVFLRQQINSGALRSGDMLPSVKDLCAQFGGINHLTVRQAIKNLAEENLVRSVQGRGSFVTEQKARERRIALVLPHLEDTLFIRIAKGAQEVLETGGVHTIILDSRGSEGVEAGHIANLKNLPLDGALIFPIADSNIAEQIFKLKLDGFCFVLVDRYFEDIAAPCVVVDNYQGGYAGAERLAAQGRQRVAWIGEVRSTPARLRLEGFRAALNDAGIACPSALIHNLEINSNAPTPYHQAARQSVRVAVDALLQHSPRPDALMCCDDLSALYALERLRELEIKVPDEIALIGFDDVPDAAPKGLTTIRQPMIQVGREAAQMLMARMQNPNLPVEKKTLPVELIARETA